MSWSNQLQDSGISIGEGTRKYLKKFSESEQKKCLLGMWSAFGAIAFYLQRKLPFRNKLLASLWCLNPQKIAASKPSDIIMIAKKLFVSDDNIVKVTDELKVFSMDQSIHSISYKRVLKMALSLPHGNADIEKRLSVNNSIILKKETN